MQILQKRDPGKRSEESTDGRANRGVTGPTGGNDLPGLGENTRISLRLRPLAVDDGLSNWIWAVAVIEWPRRDAPAVKNLSKISVNRGGEHDPEH